MRKFFVLLKKEIKELFTIQMFIPILIGGLVFLLLGSVMSGIAENADEESGSGKIVVLDLDASSFSGDVIKLLNDEGFDITTKHQGDISSVIDEAKKIGADAVIVLPKDFGKNAMTCVSQSLDVYSVLGSLSLMGQTGDYAAESSVYLINEYVSDLLIAGETENADPDVIKNPVVKNDYVVINGKTANVNATELKSFVTAQTVFVPIVMFMIIVYSAQLLITALASEKENKTMETLLSTPVSRSSIIGVKMVVSGIAALVYALVYMLGFQYYIGSMTGVGALGGGDHIKDAMVQLGLTLGVGDYILIGLSLFAGILVALAMSSILGSMAEDVKKAQGYITPVMLLVLVPYLFTLVTDISTASLPVKIILNVIPFSHPFQASNYLFLNQYAAVILGILYQFILFAVLLAVAAKIYSSDRIFTVRHSTKLFARKKTR